MKQLTKLILITFQLSFSAFGAEEPTTPQADKPALSITAFTLKSSDGKFEMKMDEKGRILVDGDHVVTANANGEFSTPDGKPLMRIKANGEVEIDGLDAPAAPVKVTRDGTLTAAGKSLSWVEGKFNFGDHRHFEITPKDSPSKQAATLMFVMISSRQEVPQAEAKIEAHLRGIDPKMRYEEVKSERLSKYLPEFRVFRGLEGNRISLLSLFILNKNGEIKDFDNDDRRAIAGFMRARMIQVKKQEDATELVKFFEELQGDTGYQNTAWKYTGKKKEGGWKVNIKYVGDLSASIMMPPEYEMDIDEQGNFLDLRATTRSAYIQTEE